MRKLMLFIVGLVTAPFIILGIYGFISTYNNASKYISTKGKVVSNVEQLFTDGDSAYVPVIKFKNDKGEEIQFQGKTGANPPYYEIGDEVDVLYNPDNPKEAILHSFMEMYFSYYMFFGIGLLVFGVAYFVIPRDV